MKLELNAFPVKRRGSGKQRTPIESKISKSSLYSEFGVKTVDYEMKTIDIKQFLMQPY